MPSLSFTSILNQDQDGTWWYAHVPQEIRHQLKLFEKRGHIKVTATIGSSSWSGSLLPWADGSAQIVINKKIRDREGLQLGQKLAITITPISKD